MRVAVGLYGLGLLYALVALTGKREVLARIILPAVGLGTIFHFVALAEAYVSFGELAPLTISQTESLLGFVLMVCFFAVYWRYKTTSPGILVFVAAMAGGMTLHDYWQKPQPKLRNEAALAEADG